MKNHFDYGSILIILITLVLFTFALFVHGFTHDLLIEVAVFLVSVKLILMAYKNSRYNRELKSELDQIKLLLQEAKDTIPSKK